MSFPRHFLFFFAVSVLIQIIINLSLLRLVPLLALLLRFFSAFVLFFVAIVKYAKNAGKKTRLEKRPNTKRELKFIARRVKQII